MFYVQEKSVFQFDSKAKKAQLSVALEPDAVLFPCKKTF